MVTNLSRNEERRGTSRVFFWTSAVCAFAIAVALVVAISLWPRAIDTSDKNPPAAATNNAPPTQTTGQGMP
jgi:hypothetical protein